MPGKSGIELAALMTARTPGMPVIIMSGYTEETLPVPRHGGRRSTLLQKPFTPRELRRRIREVLDRSSAQKLDSRRRIAGTAPAAA